MSVNTKVNGQLVKSAGLYSVSTPIGMADIYSTEEKEVGLWKNNKPLYQKTLVYNKTNIQGNSTFDITSDLTEVETIYDFKSSIDYSVGSATATEYADNYAVLTKDGNSYKIKLAIGNTTLTTADITITIQYTKTTDTPWSGKFVPQGYGYVSSGDIYSFEERQVGVFTDGKPLYQKTLYFDGTVPKNTWTDHNISDVDKIWVYDAFGKRSSDYRYNGINYFGSDDYMAMAINRTQIYIAYPTQTVMTNDYITVRYTKTTDVAGSGEYVPSGDKAVHYSTEEEVIGTFMGKTLYRKVFNFSTPLPASSQQWEITDIPTSSLNVETLVNSVCICDSAIYPCAVSCDTNDTYVSILSVRTVTVTVKTLIIEYTKAS